MNALNTHKAQTGKKDMFYRFVPNFGVISAEYAALRASRGTSNTYGSNLLPIKWKNMAIMLAPWFFDGFLSMFTKF